MRNDKENGIVEVMSNDEMSNPVWLVAKANKSNKPTNLAYKPVALGERRPQPTLLLHTYTMHTVEHLSTLAQL